MKPLYDAEGKRRPYSSFNERERLQWHTHVYAHRIVYMGAPETEHSWAGDPEGIWFNPDLIAREVTRLQNEKARRNGSENRRLRDPRDDPHVKAQRVAFAKLKGFPSWQACLDAMWKDAEDHPHADNGQPNGVGALTRKGSLGREFMEFCAEWGKRLVRQRMAWKPPTP